MSDTNWNRKYSRKTYRKYRAGLKDINFGKIRSKKLGLFDAVK